MGAPASQTGLGSAEAPEPPSGLRPAGAIPRAAFTPGPWDFERNPDPRDVPRPWIGRLADGRYSALACGGTDAEAIANARLIAAAPELYEALDPANVRTAAKLLSDAGHGLHAGLLILMADAQDRALAKARDAQ